MPSLEGRGYCQAEKEWGNEFDNEKNYEEKWKDAEAKLQKFLADYNANTSMIPTEDYNSYLEEAKFYQEVSKMHPGDVNKKLQL